MKICSFICLFCQSVVAGLLPVIMCSATAEEYTFSGYHFLASYSECDTENLCNVEGLKHAMQDAARASGATLLLCSDHIFPPYGLTMVILLSESHASIHTYPEHKSCFVDLFTCGNRCSAEKFDEILRNYLRPKQVNIHKLHRHEATQLCHCTEYVTTS